MTKRIVWAFRPGSRDASMTAVHLFLVLDGERPSPLAACGWRRPHDSKLAPVTLDDKRFDGITFRLCRTCSRDFKLNPAFVGQTIQQVTSGLDWFYEYPLWKRRK